MLNEITDADYFSTISSTPQAIVMFWADWCHHCKGMKASVLPQLAEEMPVYICDIESNPVISDKLQLFALPTFVIYRQGEEYKRIAGTHTYEQLKSQCLDG